MLASITGSVVAMHRAFHVERRLVELNLCPCELHSDERVETEVRSARRRGGNPKDGGESSSAWP